MLMKAYAKSWDMKTSDFPNAKILDKKGSEDMIILGNKFNLTKKPCKKLM